MQIKSEESHDSFAAFSQPSGVTRKATRGCISPTLTWCMKLLLPIILKEIPE